MPDDSYYTSRRAVCGCSTSLILMAMGIVSLIWAVNDRNDYKDPRCGVNGKPPLRDWLFGTGISFIIIAIAFIVTNKRIENKKSLGCFGCIAGVSSLFLLSWAIVGAVSISKAKDCETIDESLYNVGLAAVIISWIVWCCGTFTVYETGTSTIEESGDETGEPEPSGEKGESEPSGEKEEA